MKNRKRPLFIGLVLAMAAPLAAAQDTTDAGNVRFHFAGYADLTYVDTRDFGAETTLGFSPIFHLQLGDRVLLETEIETEANSQGARTAGFEYAAANILLGDHAALVIGKFLSPVGYFFPNMHPSWINKLPSAPAGFGHGGGTPLTDVGVQLRGGTTFASGKGLNYAVYAGNGPTLGLEDGEDLDLESEGSIHNDDGERVAGGRVGWIPRAGIELGASLARGRTRITGASPMEEGAEPAEPMDLSMEPSRSYSVDGLDGVWHVNKALELRGEWIRTRVGSAPTSVVPTGATWRTWYTQGAYRFGGDRWEAVARYGQSRSPHPEATFDQLALGLNRLLSSHAQVKVAWEFNDSADALAGADRLLLQIAYAF